MEFGIPVAIDTPRGTLAFNTGSSGGDYRLSRFDGMDGGSVRNPVDPVPQRDGAVVYPFLRGARFPILEGQITFPDGALSTRRQLEDNLRGYTDAILATDGTLRFTPSGAAERRCAVRLLEALQIRGGPGTTLKEFQIALIAGDPLVYASVLQTSSSTVLTAGSGGTFTIPFTIPFTFGTSTSGGIVTASNGGNAKTWPTVRIFGAVTAPGVLNTTNGKLVQFPGLVVNAGDYAEIDMRDETVLLNGSAQNSLLRYLDPAVSEFWPLEIGANNLQLVGGNPDANARITVLWNDAYI